MSASNKNVFHIGLHKTGTSYLQTQVLNHVSEIQLIRGTRNLRSLKSYKEGQTVLFSDESFSGELFGGSYLADFYKNMKIIEKVLGKDIKIIFGIRKPNEFAQSIYKQYVHEGGTKPFEYIYNIDGSGIIKLKDLFYKERIEYLENNFSDVFVYEQQSLKNNFEEFSKALEEFLEIDSKITQSASTTKSNVGIKTNLQFKTLLFLNKFKFPLFRKLFNKIGLSRLSYRNICQNYLGRFKSDKFEFPIETMSQINEKTNKDWSFALSKLSYRYEL